MITLVLLAIITSIAIPAYRNYIKNARMVEAQNSIAALKLAEEEYYLENNNYFSGNNTAALNTNSGGLWQAESDDNGNINFDYAVTLSGGGYKATATGLPNTPVAGETVIFTKK